jgi:hypothetical protein
VKSIKESTNQYNKTDYIYILEYFKIIISTLFKPKEVFKNQDITYKHLTGFIIISSIVYAILANIFRSYSLFMLLILSPLSIIPHWILTATGMHLIFNKVFQTDSSFSKCAKTTGYILVSLLPLISIVFCKNHDSPLLLTAKIIPFVLFTWLTYVSTQINYAKLSINKIIQGNILYLLIVLLISSIIFSIDMSLLIIISKLLFNYNYVWTFYDT